MHLCEAYLTPILSSMTVPTPDLPRKKPRQKDYYPLLGRVRISRIVAATQRKVIGDKGNGEFIRYLNAQLEHNPRFRPAYERLGKNLFNTTNLRKLLEAGIDNEYSFDVALLQFIAPFTGEYSFGNLMDILGNTGDYKMGEVAGLIYIAIAQHELSKERIVKRLQKVDASNAGITVELFIAFQEGILIPDQEQIRVLKEVLDPDEDFVSEAQWFNALLTDSGIAYPQWEEETSNSDNCDENNQHAYNQ